MLSLETDLNPSEICRREESGHRHYFYDQSPQKYDPGQDLIHDPMICSQTRYQLHYLAHQKKDDDISSTFLFYKELKTEKKMLTSYYKSRQYSTENRKK